MFDREMLFPLAECSWERDFDIVDVDVADLDRERASCEGDAVAVCDAVRSADTLLPLTEGD